MEISVIIIVFILLSVGMIAYGISGIKRKKIKDMQRNWPWQFGKYITHTGKDAIVVGSGWIAIGGVIFMIAVLILFVANSTR